MSKVVTGKGPVLRVDHHDLDFTLRGGPPGAAYVARAISNEVSPNIGIGLPDGRARKSHGPCCMTR